MNLDKIQTIMFWIVGQGEFNNQRLHPVCPQIVENALQKLADAEAPPASRPKPTNLTRTAQRVRQNMRPKDPKDLDFEV